MDASYSVVFSGRLREGETPDAVKVRLAELFRIKPEQLEPFFFRAPAVLRRGLDEATAARWVAAIEKAGGLCWVEPERAEPDAAIKPPSLQQVEPGPVHPHEPAAAVPAAPAPAVMPLVAPLTPAARLAKDRDVVPFPKCPKCGRLAESTKTT